LTRGRGASRTKLRGKALKSGRSFKKFREVLEGHITLKQGEFQQWSMVRRGERRAKPSRELRKRKFGKESMNAEERPGDIGQSFSTAWTERQCRFGEKE